MKNVKEKSFIVYKHTNKINGKMYVGITSQNPKHRWNYGISYKNNLHFNNSIKKYGWDNFEHKILFANLTTKEAKEIEIELIDYHKLNDDKFGYNVSKGGDLNHLGHKHSALAKKRMSENHADFKGANSTSSMKIICIETKQIFNSIGEAGRILGCDHRGVHNVLKGKSKSCLGLHFDYLKNYDPNKEYDLSVGYTEKSRKKISDANKGRTPWNKNKKLSQETKDKISRANKGRKVSDEEKLNRSQACMNNKNSKKVICIETQQIFPSISEAARVLNLSIGNIAAICRKERAQTHGLHFEYYKEI